VRDDPFGHGINLASDPAVAMGGEPCRSAGCRTRQNKHHDLQQKTLIFGNIE